MTTKTLSPELIESCCTVGAALTELRTVKRNRDWTRAPWVTRWLLRASKQVWQQARAEKADAAAVLEAIDAYIRRIDPDLVHMREFYARVVRRSAS